MNRIRPPLKIEDRGPGVADLQDGLQLILEGDLLSRDDEERQALLGGLRRERGESTFGPMTEGLVRLFQERHQLRVSGAVDAPTADIVNTVLEGLGAFEAEHPPESGHQMVGGEVRREDGVPLRNVRVRANHASGDRLVRLGEDVTDREGRYTIRYENPPGLPSVDLRITVLDQDGRLLHEAEVVRGARPLEVVDVVVPVTAPRAASRIEGQVVIEHGGPAEGLELRLYRRDFGGKATLLAETSTVTGGHYAFTHDGDAGAVLEVRAVRSDDDATEIALSEPLRDVARQARTVVNLAAPGDLRPLDAEYQRLTTDLTARVGELTKLADARENGDRQDLTVLNRAAGWDSRLIALAAVAERLAADPDVALPREGLYGLLRAGLPSDKRLLAQVDPRTVARALRTVREAGVVGLTDVEVEGFQTRFTAFRDNVRMNIPAPGSRSTVGDLLRESGLPEEARTRFAQVFLDHSENGTDLWKAAREAGLEESQVRTLRLQGKLAFLAGNGEAMTTRLMAKGVDDPAQLVAMDLHQPEAWTAELLDLAGIPADRLDDLDDAEREKLDELIPTAYAGDAVGDRLRSYAEDMARKIRLSYPAQVLVRRLETEEAYKLPAAHDDTIALVKRAERKGFRLGRTPVAAFLNANPDLTGDAATPQTAAARRQLQALQRIYQITPADEAMPVLMALNMTSAYDVMAYAESEFEALFKARYHGIHKKEMPRGMARLIRRKAEQVSSVTYNLYTIAKKLEGEPAIAGLSPTPEVRESVQKELIKQYPTMESLFGSQDYCDCEHCRSVLSPAAYLVDLFQFLDPESNEWENFQERWRQRRGGEEYPHVDANGSAMRPYDVLVERRPDLPHIPLTCENTHTALPYIDIANEILEFYVAHGKLESDAARDTGEATTAELLAEPQNVIREAYDEVRGARYPLDLPFDLWIETVRGFCNHFEMPLAHVLDILRPGDELFGSPYGRAAVFFESLGLAPAEAAIFTDTEPLNGWHELYGYATAADATEVAVDEETGQRSDLNSAKTLSRRLGVTYKELVEIVRTEFVNPALAPLGLLYDLGVSIHDAIVFIDHNDDAPPATDEEQKQQLEVQAFRDRLTAFAREHRSSTRPRPAVPLPGQPTLLTDPEVAALVAELQAEVEAIPFDRVLVLADPDAGCDFEKTTLRYADRSAADAIAFLRINLFVRLWRKLGWSVEETDRALTAFVPKSAPFDEDPANLAKKPLETALIYLSHLKALDEKLRAGKQSRLELLTLWTDIPTTGRDPLYARLFLTPGVLRGDPVFDDPLGHYLSDPSIKFGPHVPALQGALGLTADEIGHILADAGILPDAGAPMNAAALTLANVSLLFRHRVLARALGLSVEELIALKNLSGLDPFQALSPDPLESIEDDHAFTQTLRFVEVVEAVEDSGFKVEDLDFLLRHHLDEAGPHGSNAADTLALLRALAEGVRAIRAEHAVADDAGAMTEEQLAQKLGLALPADVVEQLLAMMNGTAEFTASKAGIGAAKRLDAGLFAGDDRVRDVTYVKVPHKEQKLTVRGVLFPDDIEALEGKYGEQLTAGQKTVFTELLAGARDAALGFFERHLRKQAAGVQPGYGFLAAEDFELLFDPSPGNGETKQDRQRRRRSRLAEVFLPFLQRRLIRQLVVETMTARTGADPVLVESLITDTRLLEDEPEQPLLGQFSSVARRGVSAAFFDAADLTGPSRGASAVVRDIDTSAEDARDGDGNSLGPAASAWFEGYLEVPDIGAYRFYVELDKQGAEAVLRFDHLPDPRFLHGIANTDGTTLGDGPDEYLELKPGVPYRFRLELTKLGGGGARLRVQGETLSKGPLSRLLLYPADAIDGADRALLLLTKSLSVVQGLGLNERETRHILTHAEDFGNIALSSLPTRAVGKKAGERKATVNRFNAFLRFAAYARLKRELGIGGDELIDVFEANEHRDPGHVYALIARLTRRSEATVEASATVLSPAPSFESERPLRRLWDTLQVVERFGAAVDSVTTWTRIVDAAATNEQRYEVARDVRESLKARLEPETWRRIAQPIFDRLRRKQRDALASYVMHQLRYDRIEQLYEHFLIDPGMEPVVQTSRIRLAIASVQLFIQRCLLNLEPKAHPSTINAKHWEWMKRYRVWEANRKIFLFPENWLEPEFRDDKTHLFKELEGTLLQGDVSNDLVEDAFLAYLKKLDELARLDIAAMHIEDSDDPAGRTLHVFGRTFGKPHSYFYRRYAHQMWTPWEPVNVPIEGDHVAPVVWRDRLYLFWVTFLLKPDPDAGPTPIEDGGKEPSLSAMTMSDAASSLGGLVQDRVVEVQLHWSEYIRGEWSTPVSSDYMLVTKASDNEGSTKLASDGDSGNGAFERSAPVAVKLTAGTLAGAGSLARVTRPGINPADFTPPTDLFVHVSKAFDESGEEAGVYIHLSEPLGCSLFLAGRNAEPQVENYDANDRRGVRPENPYASANKPRATRYKGGGPFRVRFNERLTTEPGETPSPATRDILKRKGHAYTLLPSNNRLTLSVSEDAAEDAANPHAVEAAIRSGLDEIASLVKPVFYQDARHTFFVEPDVTEHTIEEWERWVAGPARPESGWEDTKWWDNLAVVAHTPSRYPLPGSKGPGTRLEIDRRSVVQQRSTSDWLLNPGTVLEFDGAFVGPTGESGLRASVAETRGQLGDIGVRVNVNPGSSVGSGDNVVFTGALTPGEYGLSVGGGGLNVVGGAGFNAALEDNYIDRDRTGFAASATAGRTIRR